MNPRPSDYLLAIYKLRPFKNFEAIAGKRPKSNTSISRVLASSPRKAEN